MDIYDRLKEFRKTLGLTQTEFAEKIGMAIRGIQRWEAKEVEIKPSSILLLQKIFNVNKDWLILGKGNMFLPAETNSAVIGSISNGSDGLPIKYYADVSASAGGGSFVENERFMTVRIDRRVCKPTKTSIIIDVVGESMEPTLMNKDKIIIDTAIDQTMLKKGKVYAISYEDKLLIKRFVEKLNNRYVFYSDNKAYTGIVMTPNDKDRIIGELKYLIYREMK